MARHTPGNYVPLDVNYARDMAIRKAGTNAELLFIRSLAYAKGARTSGFVSDFDIEVVAVGMRAVKAATEKLVEVGLWVRLEEGWRVRSWERWNAGTEAVSAGGKLGNHKRWHADRSVIDPDCDLCSDREGIAPDLAPESPSVSGSESQGKGREGKKKTTSSLSDDSDDSDLFAEFWKHYPRKDSKQDAMKAWKQVTKSVKPAVIVEAVQAYPFKPERNFQPLPGSWLRGRRWEDEAVQLPLEASGQLTSTDVQNILGPDHWTLPRPPLGLSDADEYAWEQRIRREHLTERQQQARARMGRTA